MSVTFFLTFFKIRKAAYHEFISHRAYRCGARVLVGGNGGELKLQRRSRRGAANARQPTPTQTFPLSASAGAGRAPEILADRVPTQVAELCR